MSICRNVFNSSDLARRSSPAGAMFGRLRWRSNAIRVALDRQGRIGMRVSGSALALLAAMTSGLAATPNRLQGAPAFSFYEWSGDVPGPGALLRSEPLPQDLTLENASKSERILYSSTNGLDDKMHIAVRALCSG